MLAVMALAAALTTTPVQSDTLTVFMGDSRTVGMESSVDDKNNEIFIAKGSMGYDWFKKTAWPEFEKVVKENPDKIINAVINFGVNDLGHEDKYAEFINEESGKLPHNVNLSWASVNPTNGSHSKLTDKILRFNEEIKNDLDSSIGYIDSYTYLSEDGYSSFDGLHYGEETNRKIHDYWVEHMDSTATEELTLEYVPEWDAEETNRMIKSASQSRTMG